MDKIRHHIVAGNWKMNLSHREAIELTNDINEYISDHSLPKHLKVIVCPPLPYLASCASGIWADVKSNFGVGGQNCHTHTSGAYTGETAPEMLRDVGCEYVLIGHSERRKYFGESHTFLAQKVNKALEVGLTPIFCCGEALDIRETNTHEAHVAAQLRESLFHLSKEDFAKVIIAYEPVWAIGTGKTATPEQAQAMHVSIRDLIKNQYGEIVASNTSILYGGSCKPANAAELFSQPDVDGGLIGGASLKAESFGDLIGIMMKCLAEVK